MVIDNSSTFRYDADVPLVVPEVNPEAARNRPRGIIANPNCSTMQLMVALKPIYDAAGIERINVATYQSVSGAGRSGLEELGVQTGQLLNFQEIEPKKFQAQIALNLSPHIDDFLDNGYTKEETVSYTHLDVYKRQQLDNSIELSLAGYNGGEGRALRVYRGSGGRSFWDYDVYSQFPAETKDYVPMVVAAAWLFLHPKEYGIRWPKVNSRPAVVRLVQPASIYELTICMGNYGSRDGYMRALRNLCLLYTSRCV